MDIVSDVVISEHSQSEIRYKRADTMSTICLSKCRCFQVFLHKFKTLHSKRSLKGTRRETSLEIQKMRLSWLLLLTSLWKLIYKVCGQEEISICFGPKRFVLVNDFLTFSEAKEACSQRDMVLAGISSLFEHYLVVELADQIHPSSVHVWLGD